MTDCDSKLHPESTLSRFHAHLESKLNPSMEATWEACLDRLYNAAGNEAELAIALGDFRPFFHADGVMFLTAPDASRKQTLHIGALGVSDDSLLQYHSHFGQYDVWAQAAWSRQLYNQLQPVRGSDLVPRSELKRTYFWREFLLRDGVTDILAALVEAPSNDTPAMTVTFQRKQGKAPFSSADISRLALLSPHLRRVMRLHRRLAPRLALGATLMELFSASELPLLFLGREGEVVEQNPAAQASLKDPDGVLQVRSGRLLGRESQGWCDARPLLDSLKTVPAWNWHLLSTNGRPARLEIKRVHAAMTDHIATHKSIAVCTLRWAAGDATEVLRSRFGLTPTETRVSLALAAGHSPNRVAVDTGTQVSTVRTHLKSAMAKIGVNRQTQLVATVLKLGTPD